MEGRLRSTVLKLSGEGTYLHFVSVRSYNKFGCQATFRGQQEGSLYHICYFSRPVLQVNTLAQHLNTILTLYRSLNSKIVTPILEVIQEGEAIFVVSRGYEWTVEALVRRREGLSEFEIAYFLVDLMELMSYLRSRDCLLEKVQLQDLFLNESQKITISFGLFLNALNQRPVLRSLPFRNECRNRNNCPDLFLKNALKLSDIDQVNSWNLGIILYELLLNSQPFSSSNEDLIAQSKTCQCAKDLNIILRKEYSLNISRKEDNPQLVQLITELLKPVADERLRFSVIVIHPFLKKFPTPPHILPTTIFSCPPSEGFKEQYFKKFLVEQRRAGELRQNRTNTQNSGMLRSQKDMQHEQEVETARGEKQFRTQMELKSSERSLSESSAIIQQFVDISDSLGFGYQMNSGLVCFVFNDQTQYYYPSGSQKEIRVRQRSRKGPQVVYLHDKLPEQDEVRKKIHILEAFQKTLKRSKSSVSEKERLITVAQYCRTKYASLFLLSNDTVQVFFNDKMGFLLSKNSILFQPKNTDHFEQYDFSKEDRDLEVRKDYCLTVARKIFLWKNFPEQRILDTMGLIDYES